MFNLFRKMTYMAALLLPLLAFGESASPPETGQKSRLEFFRSGEKMAIFQARIDVNGRRVGEIGRGESTYALIEPGRTLVNIDSALSPGQFKFSFTAEKGTEYRFELSETMDKIDVEHLFGLPPKAPNGDVLESGGVLKAILFSANQPKAAGSEPAVVSKPAKIEPAPEPAPAPAPALAAKAPLSIEEQLRALKHLYEQELISKEAYIEKQQKILDTLK